MRIDYLAIMLTIGTGPLFTPQVTYARDCNYAPTTIAINECLNREHASVSDSLNTALQELRVGEGHTDRAGKRKRHPMERPLIPTP